VDRRRFLLTSLIGVLAGPTGAEAQQAGGPMRIGVLTPQSRETGAAVWESFRQGLRELGWAIRPSRRSGVRLKPRPTGSAFNSRDWRCEMLRTSAERSRRQ
jgi:hypothetical protein